MEELLKREYGDFLSDDEIRMAMTFYRFTKNQIKTAIICDEMKKAFYAKNFGRSDDAAMKRMNDEIAIFSCLRLIGKPEKFFLDQPLDVQDEIINIYDAGKADEDMREKLCKLLRLAPDDIPKENKEIVFSKPDNEEKTEKKESLLVQLKRFQAEVNRKYREKKKL